MAAPIHQKEVVRLLSLEHGMKRASELANVPYDVVRQWSVRGKWKQSQSVTAHPVKVAADAVASELREHERETRLSLARSARNMSKDAEALPVRHAKLAHTVAQTAAIVHNWQQRESHPGIVNLNVLANKAAVQVVQGDPDVSE